MSAYRENVGNVPFEQLLREFDLFVEVRSFRLKLDEEKAEWRAAFAKALDDWGFVLKADGELAVKEWERDETGRMVNSAAFTLRPIGNYCFFEPSEVVVPNDSTPLECPFVRPTYGYLAVKIGWSAWRSVVRQLVTALIKESMGRIFSAVRDERSTQSALAYVCTKKQSFPLMLSKYSIDDGDVLLSREDNDYLAYVIAEIKAALEKHGYAGELGVTATSHNPFRYWTEEEARSWRDWFGRPRGNRFYIFGPNGSRPNQRQLETFLDRHSFEIWVFDFDAVDAITDSVGVSSMLW